MSKDANKKYWIKSGMYSFLEKGAGFVFNFGSILMLIRSLSIGDMGAWFLFLTVCAFMEVSRIGLLQNALVKYISSDGDKHYKAILTASSLLNIGLTVGYVIFLLIFGSWFGQLWQHEGLTTLFHIYAITTVFLMPLHQFNYIQQANMDFRGIFWTGLVKQGSFFFYVLFLWLGNVEMQLQQLAIFQIVGASLGVFVGYYFAIPYLRFSTKIDWKWIEKLGNFGKFAIGTNLSSMLYKSMDKMMLGSMVSVAAVAIYEMAIKITNLLEIPTLSAAPVVFPQSAKEAVKNGKAAVADLYEKSVGLILTMILACILVVQLMPELIITLIAGDQYLETIPLLRIVIFFGCFTPFLYQTGMVLESIGKPNINFYFTLCSFFLNMLLNILFIKQFGIIGAAYGTLVTYLIVFTAGQLMLKKLVGVQTANIFTNILYFYKEGFKFFKRKVAEVSSPPVAVK